MSEPTDLDQIAALEERITTALDRIARGVASRRTGGDAGASGETSAEMQERLTAQIAALEETQAALASEQAAHAAISDQLRAVEAARKADSDEAARELTKAKDAAQAEVAKAEALQADLTKAETAAADAVKDAEDADSPVDAAQTALLDDAAIQKMEAELEHRRSVEDILRRRIGRLREERNISRAERGDAREQLDEVQSKLDQLSTVANIDTSGAAKELLRLRESNRSLRDTIEEMREGISDDNVANGDLVTAALASELESLRAERAADAHEARSILIEIQPIIEGGTANA